MPTVDMRFTTGDLGMAPGDPPSLESTIAYEHTFVL